MTTDLEIYQARAAQARARIAADQAAGRGATRLDLYRLELNEGLAGAAILAELMADGPDPR
jgi:hypothetical protein